MFYKISEDVLICVNNIRFIEFYDSGHGSACMRYSVKVAYIDGRVDFHHLNASSKEESRKVFEKFCNFLEGKKE